MDPLLPLLLAIGDKTGQDVDLRRRIYQTILSYPGLHAADIARRTAIKEPSARYHLHMMVRLGLAQEVDETGYVRYYPSKTPEGSTMTTLGRNEKRALGVLRRPVPLRIVLALLGEEDARTMGWIAEEAGVANATASYHVKNLAQAELVTVEKRHRERLIQVKDPQWVVGLLVAHPPPRDMVEGFIELWDRLEV